MPYYYKEVKCDTLAELQALRNQDLERPTNGYALSDESGRIEKAPPPGYNFHPDYRCPEYVLGQTGSGLGYERCNFRKGHSGRCEA